MNELSFEQGYNLLKVLTERGLTQDDVNLVAGEDATKLVDSIVEIITHYQIPYSDSYQEVLSELLGPNIITPWQALNIRRVAWNDVEWKKLFGNIPFPPSIFYALKQDCWLFVSSPLSIEDLYKEYHATIFYKGIIESKSNNIAERYGIPESVTNEKIEPGWHCILKNGGCNIRHLKTEYPNACDLVFLMVASFLNNHQSESKSFFDSPLCSEKYMLCQSPNKDEHLGVRFTKEEGISLTSAMKRSNPTHFLTHWETPLMVCQ